MVLRLDHRHFGLQRTMAILFLIIFMDLVGFGLLLPLLPFYVQRVGAGPETITLVLGLYSVGQFVAAPFWGRLSDSVGRKPVLVATSLGLAASYVMLAYADSLILLVFVRLFGGIMAGNIAAAQAYISDITTPATRAKGMGMLGAAFGLGFIFGPAIGGILGGSDLATADFISPALAAAAVTLIAAAGAMVFLEESLKPEQCAARRMRSDLSFRQELRKVFGRRVLALLTLVGFLTITAWSMFETVFALWANAAFRYGPAQIGYVLTFIGVISVIIQGGAIGALTRRFGERALAVSALGFLTVGYIALALSGTTSHMVLACGALGIGSALFNPSLSSLVSREAADHECGAVLGAYQSATALGRVIGPAFSGLVFARLGPPAPFLLAAAAAVPALGLLWLARRR
ncbi:MAG: MFS transporter [Rhodospirillaceae bacterium]|nr:MFS transporter [Rhodospirillaceae bacterium]